MHCVSNHCNGQDRTEHAATCMHARGKASSPKVQQECACFEMSCFLNKLISPLTVPACLDHQLLLCTKTVADLNALHPDNPVNFSRQSFPAVQVPLYMAGIKLRKRIAPRCWECRPRSATSRRHPSSPKMPFLTLRPQQIVWFTLSSTQREGRYFAAIATSRKRSMSVFRMPSTTGVSNCGEQGRTGGREAGEKKAWVASRVLFFAARN